MTLYQTDTQASKTPQEGYRLQPQTGWISQHLQHIEYRIYRLRYVALYGQTSKYEHSKTRGILQQYTLKVILMTYKLRYAIQMYRIT